MAAHKPAFKAFDMQALINKINKSVVAPLPTKYSGPLRGLIKSMLRKNPEHRPSAAELLKHPVLQPYVLKIRLKSSPSRNPLSLHKPACNYTKNSRFPESEDISPCKDKEKRRSFSNDRNLKPSASATELDSVCSTRRIQEFPSYLNQRFGELSVGSSYNEDTGVDKPINAKAPSIAKTPRSTPAKTSSTPRRRTEPSKINLVGANRESLPAASRTPAVRGSTRRASLPLPTRGATLESPFRPPNTPLFHRINSPDVSVNAPRIDRIAEFPLASSEDPIFSIGRHPSLQGSCTSSPRCGNRSITKDKCTIQINERASTSKPRFSEGRCLVDMDGHSEGSDRNPMAEGSSRTSSESRQRRFDTSSYQQRAEALEGLLEFSARLLHQERFDELGILLKPFGPGKASPRETAIWLTKSIKETTVKQD